MPTPKSVPELVVILGLLSRVIAVFAIWDAFSGRFIRTIGDFCAALFISAIIGTRAPKEGRSAMWFCITVAAIAAAVWVIRHRFI